MRALVIRVAIRCPSVAIAFFLIACATTPAAAPPASSISTPVAPTGTIVTERSCGEITAIGTPARFSANSTATQSIACFLRAVETCAPETLTIRESASGYIRQFSIQPAAGSCLIRQALQTDAAAPPAIADCASARAENGGIVIAACSHLGDFLLVPQN